MIIWGKTIIDGLTPLHVFNCRSVTHPMYPHNVLKPYEGHFKTAFLSDHLFMDNMENNVHPHRANIIENSLKGATTRPEHWASN